MSWIICRRTVLIKCDLRYARDANMIIHRRTVLIKCDLNYAQDAKIRIK